jgi:hypothetical protein
VNEELFQTLRPAARARAAANTSEKIHYRPFANATTASEENSKAALFLQRHANEMKYLTTIPLVKPTVDLRPSEPKTAADLLRWFCLASVGLQRAKEQFRALLLGPCGARNSGHDASLRYICTEPVWPRTNQRSEY